MVSLPIKFKKALMIIGAFFWSSIYLTAQTPGLGTWNVLTGRFNYNSKWNAFIELQLRSQQTLQRSHAARLVGLSRSHQAAT